MTAPQTITYPGGGDSADGMFFSGDLFPVGFSPLSGFAKFDPALGTLEEIVVSVEISGSYELGIYSDGLDDAEEPFTLYYDAGLGVSLATDLVYNEGGGGFGDVVGNEDYPVSEAVGVFDDDPSFYGAPDAFYFEENAGPVSYGGFADGGTDLFTTTIPAESIILGDFVGASGTVDVLELAFYAVVSTDFPAAEMGSNLFSGSVFFSFQADGMCATLHYVYTPGAAPAPEITGYALSGTTHTIHFSGEAGQSDWEVMGGSDPENLAVDHTGSSVITEPTPGNYQAVVSLPSLSAPKYFLQVRR